MPHHSAASWRSKLDKYKVKFSNIVLKVKKTINHEQTRKLHISPIESVPSCPSDAEGGEESTTGDRTEVEQLVQRPDTPLKNGLEGREKKDFEIIVGFLVEKDLDTKDEDEL